MHANFSNENVVNPLGLHVERQANNSSPQYHNLIKHSACEKKRKWSPQTKGLYVVANSPNSFHKKNKENIKENMYIDIGVL